MGAISFHISGRYNMEEKKKINEEEMKKISGGNMLWGRTCKICGGVITHTSQPELQVKH
jgi:bacteriocin-like protein